MSVLTHNDEPITERDRLMLLTGALVLEKAMITCLHPHPKTIRLIRQAVSREVFGLSDDRVRSLYETQTRAPVSGILGVGLRVMRERIPALFSQVLGTKGFGGLIAQTVKRAADDAVAEQEPIPPMTDSEIDRLWRERGGGRG